LATPQQTVSETGGTMPRANFPDTAGL